MVTILIGAGWALRHACFSHAERVVVGACEALVLIAFGASIRTGTAW